jgi:cytochrome b pre-mRNA-processing protein 3
LPDPAGGGKPMILNRIFRKAGKPERRLYEAIVAAARHPTPYASWGVADSLDGRFDMIALYMYLALDRLKGEAGRFRQSLVDEFFADMDRSLREMGVGDISVGKKVRKMAEVFYGRVAAYDKAMGADKEALAEALARNVFPGGSAPGAAEKLADYALTSRQALAGQSADRLTKGIITFPEPRP